MAADSTAKDVTAQKHSILDSSFPVLLPLDKSLFLPEPEFQAFVKKVVIDARNPHLRELEHEIADIEGDGKDSRKRRASEESGDEPVRKAPFVEALKKHTVHVKSKEELAAENKTLTDNADVTNVSSQNPLVDLFYDLNEDIASDRLKKLLDNAWEDDPSMTLKTIFNARSIHLGKSNRVVTYKAFGWLADNHPITLLTNLKWLVRPIIEKKGSKPDNKDDSKREETDVKKVEDNNKVNTKDEDDDFEMVDPEEGIPSDPTKAHDVRFGVSHGYWKDLLNLVVFAANDQLKFDGNPTSLLSQQQDKSKRGKRTRLWDQQAAKASRKQKRKEQHERVVDKLQNDGFYCALHLTVARLFAEQLREDGVLLKSDKKSDRRKLSLAAKWAPTFGEFHDKQTFILSTIAEGLYPNPAEICPNADDRELYLRHAREAYRKNYASPIRKVLAIVERDIAAERFGDIKYERVPSLAMDRYTPLFMRKDYEHFSSYVEDVAKGKMKISGATLLPSTLVRKAQQISGARTNITNASFAVLKASKEAQVNRKVIDGQWKTLVQRVKDAGALNSSIAVCDVSGSMNWPQLGDKTVPMDSSIGLSLLVSEVTAPPFGGGFVTFSATPTYVSVGGPEDTRGLVEKVQQIKEAVWSMNTNFVAVFEDVILPMALRHHLKQEDMVKQVFVFSDMQFDQAQHDTDRWTSSYDRVKEKYAAAGYELPRLIFWNLAGHNDKPVTMDDQNTALVSGYSQGMLKTFLDGGGFDEEGEDEVVEEAAEGEDAMTEIKVKKKMDPLTLVKKAVSHKAYSMLEVVD